MRLITGILASAVTLGSSQSWAQVALEGQFTANKSCAALTSIKKQRNPGHAKVQAGQTYQVLGKNNETGDYYWIKLPQENPDMRWVSASCGTLLAQANAPQAVPPLPPSAGSVEKPIPPEIKNPPHGVPPLSLPSASSGKPPLPDAVNAPHGVPPLPLPADKTDKPKSVGGGSGTYVFSLSWQPAFCEFMPGKLECRQQTPDSYSASHLSLHGLWVQPSRLAYCNVKADAIKLDEQRDWRSLAPPKLSTATRAGLDRVMPGTRSYLDRHEWIKHGTCYPGGDAEAYFSDSVRLMDEVNTSAVQKLLSSRIGKRVTSAEIRASFDQAFGAGAGSRVRVACKMDGVRQVISEVTLGLKGNISSGTSLAQLLKASSPTDPGCPGGIIDQVGLE